MNDPSAWKAFLDLAFVADRGTTALVRRSQSGPLVVQRPFYPEGPGTCHVYLLHPPGGLVAGDALILNVEVGPAAHVLLTSPAATKVYRSDGKTATQEQIFHVRGNGMAEWLPQETILFNGSRSTLTTRVALDAQASFIGWEILSFGRPASDDLFRQGQCLPSFELWRDDEPLVMERATVTPATLDGFIGLRGAKVMATLWAASPRLDADTGARLLQALRALPGSKANLLGCTHVRGALIFRYLGHSTEVARMVCEKAWHMVRPILLGRPAQVPRIWST